MGGGRRVDRTARGADGREQSALAHVTAKARVVKFLPKLAAAGQTRRKI